MKKSRLSCSPKSQFALLALFFTALALYKKNPSKPLAKQTLDVYYQIDRVSTKKPVIIWIHGGAWKFGSKSRNISTKAKAFTDSGYIFVAINYRLHPHANWHEQAQDVAAACHWVNKNITTYNGDPRHLILMGHSAGAHLAALTGADHSFFAAHRVPVASVKSIVLLDGAGYDLPELKAASPVYHFRKKKLNPPYLIIPIASRNASISQSKRLAHTIQATGGTASIFIAQNRTHKSLNQKIGKPGDHPTKVILAFLASQRVYNTR